MSETDSPFHILFVEDDDVDIQAVEREIVKLDVPIQLHYARDGIEALDMLYGKNGVTRLAPIPHLILLDINLPRMSGTEFLKKLQEDPEFKHIPVYFLTTAYTTHDKMATKGLHIAGHIIKPLQYDELMQIYWSLLGK